MVVLTYPLIFRHSEDMIKKLENAGLGFYVRETDTTQKLGNLYNKVVCYTCQIHISGTMCDLLYEK